MENAIRYIRIDFEGDTKDLINHLSMNGYSFGFDSMAESLFVLEDEIYYVITIMDDREIKYQIEK